MTYHIIVNMIDDLSNVDLWNSIDDLENLYWWPMIDWWPIRIWLINFKQYDLWHVTLRFKFCHFIIYHTSLSFRFPLVYKRSHPSYQFWSVHIVNTNFAAYIHECVELMGHRFNHVRQLFSCGSPKTMDYTFFFCKATKI